MSCDVFIFTIYLYELDPVLQVDHKDEHCDGIGRFGSTSVVVGVNIGRFWVEACRFEVVVFLIFGGPDPAVSNVCQVGFHWPVSGHG